MTTNRRTFLKTTGLAAAAAQVRVQAQVPGVSPAVSMAQTPVLNIGYHEYGSRQGFPVILLHGFPDDAHAFDEVAPVIAKAGHRVIVPYLRGYGPTRFRDPKTPRMAEQAAIGQDVIDLADALKLQRFAVGGFDWGGRAAGIAAALHPDRVRAAVLAGGYPIQDVYAKPEPAAPEVEYPLWYQWYFQTERGRAGLAAYRHAYCRLLWKLWSPTWRFTEDTYKRTAASFDNPEFVDVVIHSYRHRHGNAPGEPRFEQVERQLSKSPKITVPTIILAGADDGIRRPPQDSPQDRALFPALKSRRVLAGVGHFVPREAPDVFAKAMIELLA